MADRYQGPADAGMSVRLFGRLPMTDAHDTDTVRSAASRTAIEAAFWAPMSLLPARGVEWHAAPEEEIIAV